MGLRQLKREDGIKNFTCAPQRTLKMLGDQGRRRQELGMSEELSWSSVSDDDLKQIMSEIQTLTPGIGQTRMLGALRSRGLKI